MSDVVLEVGVENPTQEVAFLHTVEAFAKWVEDALASEEESSDAPNLIIKTVCSAEGLMAKQVIFSESSWAKQFMNLWQSELSNAA